MPRSAETQGNRRGRGEGSLTQLRTKGVDGASENLWMGRVTLGPGQRRSVYGRTKTEALQKMRAAATAGERGEPQPDARVTLGTFLAEWLSGPAARKVRPSTLAAYSHYVNAHLIPGLGHHKLVTLRPEHIDAFLAGRVRPPYALSPRTVQQLRAILRSALSWAERNGRVTRNVAKLSEPPRLTREPVVPLTAEDARKLVAAVEDTPEEALGPLIVLALDTGLRQGELLGLRWEDVDLDALTLRVVQTRQAVGGGPTFGDPKSLSSRRSVRFSELSLRMLRRQRAQQAAWQLRSRSWTETGLVFTRSTGQALDGSSVTHRFQRFLGQHGLPQKRFHDLRHTSASILLGSGMPMKVVSDRLGHATISITVDTYGHIGVAAQEAAAAEMDRVLGGG